jgi:hypothetical protein
MTTKEKNIFDRMTKAIDAWMVVADMDDRCKEHYPFIKDYSLDLEKHYEHQDHKYTIKTFWGNHGMVSEYHELTSSIICTAFLENQKGYFKFAIPLMPKLPPETAARCKALMK